MKFNIITLMLLFFSVNISYGMKRVPAVRTSIHRLDRKFTHRSPRPQYNKKATSLKEIKDYFELLFEEAHRHECTYDIEFLEQMRRVRAGLKRSSDVRAGYVSAIKYLEH